MSKRLQPLKTAGLVILPVTTRITVIKTLQFVYFISFDYLTSLGLGFLAYRVSGLNLMVFLESHWL